MKYREQLFGSGNVPSSVHSNLTFSLGFSSSTATDSSEPTGGLTAPESELELESESESDEESLSSLETSWGRGGVMQRLR
jgi:hypothetical protein